MVYNLRRTTKNRSEIPAPKPRKGLTRKKPEPRHDGSIGVNELSSFIFKEATMSDKTPSEVGTGGKANTLINKEKAAEEIREANARLGLGSTKRTPTSEKAGMGSTHGKPGDVAEGEYDPYNALEEGRRSPRKNSVRSTDSGALKDKAAQDEKRTVNNAMRRTGSLGEIGPSRNPAGGNLNAGGSGPKPPILTKQDATNDNQDDKNPEEGSGAKSIHSEDHTISPKDVDGLVNMNLHPVNSAPMAVSTPMIGTRSILEGLKGGVISRIRKKSIPEENDDMPILSPTGSVKDVDIRYTSEENEIVVNRNVVDMELATRHHGKVLDHEELARIDWEDQRISNVLTQDDVDNWEDTERLTPFRRGEFCMYSEMRVYLERVLGKIYITRKNLDKANMEQKWWGLPCGRWFKGSHCDLYAIAPAYNREGPTGNLRSTLYSKAEVEELVHKEKQEQEAEAERKKENPIPQFVEDENGGRKRNPKLPAQSRKTGEFKMPAIPMPKSGGKIRKIKKEKLSESSGNESVAKSRRSEATKNKKNTSSRSSSVKRRPTVGASKMIIPNPSGVDLAVGSLLKNAATTIYQNGGEKEGSVTEVVVMEPAVESAGGPSKGTRSAVRPVDHTRVDYDRMQNGGGVSSAEDGPTSGNERDDNDSGDEQGSEWESLRKAEEILKKARNTLRGKKMSSRASNLQKKEDRGEGRNVLQAHDPFPRTINDSRVGNTSKIDRIPIQKTKSEVGEIEQGNEVRRQAEQEALHAKSMEFRRWKDRIAATAKRAIKEGITSIEGEELVNEEIQRQMAEASVLQLRKELDERSEARSNRSIVARSEAQVRVSAAEQTKSWYEQHEDHFSASMVGGHNNLREQEREKVPQEVKPKEPEVNRAQGKRPEVYRAKEYKNPTADAEKEREIPRAQPKKKEEEAEFSNKVNQMRKEFTELKVFQLDFLKQMEEKWSKTNEASGGKQQEETTRQEEDTIPKTIEEDRPVRTTYMATGNPGGDGSDGSNDSNKSRRDRRKRKANGKGSGGEKGVAKKSPPERSEVDKIANTHTTNLTPDNMIQMIKPLGKLSNYTDYIRFKEQWDTIKREQNWGVGLLKNMIFTKLEGVYKDEWSIMPSSICEYEEMFRFLGKVNKIGKPKRFDLQSDFMSHVQGSETVRKFSIELERKYEVQLDREEDYERNKHLLLNAFRRGLNGQIKQKLNEEVGIEKQKSYTYMVERAQIYEETAEQRTPKGWGKTVAAAQQEELGKEALMAGVGESPLQEITEANKTEERKKDLPGKVEVCKKCDKVGHAWWQCLSTKKCFNCQELGHLSMRCPRPRKESGRGRGAGVGAGGFTKFNGNYVKPLHNHGELIVPQTQQDKQKIRCDYCGRQGHGQNQCYTLANHKERGGREKKIADEVLKGVFAAMKDMKNEKGPESSGTSKGEEKGKASDL